MSAFESYSLLFQGLSLLVAFGIGGLQCALIYSGLKQMREASEQRHVQVDAQAKALEATGAALHEQVALSQTQRADQHDMTAGIRALLERQA